MSDGVQPTTSVSPYDWDQHWSVYGEPVQANPANGFRRRLVLKLLGSPSPGATIVDIGSGQGELALYLQTIFPECEVIGIEYSGEGVRRSREAAAALGSKAKFIQRDLLQTAESVLPGSRKASFAICSEVLEHVDHPEILLENAAAYLAPGCRIVVTVPGGPRSAFDRHIGHRQHFRPLELARLLGQAGFEVDRTYRAGFPFFNLYRIAVIARGKRLIADLQDVASHKGKARAGTAISGLFDALLRWNLDSSPFGWQVAAVATYRGHGETA